MKNSFVTISMLAAAVALGSSTCSGAGANQSRVCFGLRQHTEYDKLDQLPFDDGDLSYTLGYEFHETSAYWLLAMDYAPSVTGVTGDPHDPDYDAAAAQADYVVTPQISLIAKDGAWRGGAGVLRSYISTSDDEEWSDVYWQIVGGVNVPMSGVSMDLLVYWIFESWQDVEKGDADLALVFSIGF